MEGADEAISSEEKARRRLSEAKPSVKESQKRARVILDEASETEVSASEEMAAEAAEVNSQQTRV